jgi:hypothetical protein
MPGSSCSLCAGPSRTRRRRFSVVLATNDKGDALSILWIILIVVLVLALLGFFGYRR